MTSSPGEGEEKEGPVIRDKRRIDPETGEVRAQGSPAPENSAGKGSQGQGSAGQSPAEQGSAVADDEVSSLRNQLSERLADLQRLKAEYDNYRKRVERDRVAVREQALGQVLSELLPVLDDIGRARDHDELHGGFKQVAESLEAVTSKLGLVKFGEKGEPFDPTVHEALMHSLSPEVTETSVVDVLQPGYRIGERVLRPARVAVADPDPDAASGESGETGGAGQDDQADGGEGRDGE